MAMIRIMLSGVIFFSVAAYHGVAVSALASSVSGGLHFHAGAMVRGGSVRPWLPRAQLYRRGRATTRVGRSGAPARRRPSDRSQRVASPAGVAPSHAASGRPRGLTVQCETMPALDALSYDRGPLPGRARSRFASSRSTLVACAHLQAAAGQGDGHYRPLNAGQWHRRATTSAGHARHWRREHRPTSMRSPDMNQMTIASRQPRRQGAADHGRSQVDQGLFCASRELRGRSARQLPPHVPLRLYRRDRRSARGPRRRRRSRRAWRR